ncbi:adenosine deaminase AGSA-like [Haliotis rufescens]|uniref:adenosine deaminase AGSA-like n=1 Tax=Haliotis rufescens TaxID=6454 RepID=UPI00201F447C|nr:adenosine deaminase AGSA-like [Haliotis rufescens]XP_048253855.1 adenosine deaminase AGSA-like [Haliotis rufescens]
MRVFICLTWLTFLTNVQSVPAWYKSPREAILATERRQSIGAMLTLTSEEEAVNKIIMAAKQTEINSAIYDHSNFIPAVHFFQGRHLMEQSKVFKIIQQMPKGAALHLHYGSITSSDWLVKNVTYRPDCYVCVKQKVITQTGFYVTPPSDKDCKWLRISAERAKSKDITEFDQWLYNNLTLTVDNPEVAYPNINVIWRRFKQYFKTVHGLLNNAPVMKDALYETLREFHVDGVQYLEIRIGLIRPYEVNGTTHDPTWFVETFRDVVNQFKQDYPDFSGAKLILAGRKVNRASAILQDVKVVTDLVKRFPDVILGYDLVQQEDVTHTLLYYISDLLYPESHSSNLPYFFHAGETDWLDIHDNNLIDAILLNTSRIGHGFAIPKHPEVMRLIKERNIPIEVNPISNQVLKLVSDLRNHPAAILISQDFPVCISSDDPAPWEALPLSHDFYMAFMALAASDDDLRFLKQLAINSMNFSGMTSQEKASALRLWETKWNSFLKHVLRSHTTPIVG